ncbi:MAG: DUF4286 family protein [Bacteroidia bacterium]
MLLYNVTVSVDESVHAHWLQWMKDTHIPEVMATGIFKTYRICKLLHPVSEEGVTYAIQYYVQSRDLLDRYFEKHAPVLQQAHAELYGNRAMAFRTILEVLD